MDSIYKSILEALIFASDEPITPQELIKAVKEIDGDDTSITPTDIEKSVTELNQKYDNEDSSFKILPIAENQSMNPSRYYYISEHVWVDDHIIGFKAVLTDGEELFYEKVSGENLAGPNNTD